MIILQRFHPKQANKAQGETLLKWEEKVKSRAGRTTIQLQHEALDALRNA